MTKSLKKISLSLLLISAAALLFAMPVIAISPPNSAVPPNEIPYESYTYWEGFSYSAKTVVYCRPMYTVGRTVNLQSLGGNEESKLGDVCCDENGYVYILDSGLSKIYILDNEYNLYSAIQSITYKGETLSVQDARGIFAKGGKIYIADTRNARVLVLGPDGNVRDLILLPDSELIPTGFEYKPLKIAVDSEGYTYVSSDGSYYGALLFSPEMEFLGFYGANNVKAGAIDVIRNLWRRLLSNDMKRAADVLRLPYQFTDIVAGPQNFVYTTTGKTEKTATQTGQVAMLNPGGRNVLGAEDNFGDLYVGSLHRQAQIQDLAGIDVDGDGFFYLIDTTYGRVFWYDKECNLLSIFGGSFGPGNQKGTFSLANSIALNGTDVLVGDEQKNSLTVFKITEYGKLVRDTQVLTLNGMDEQALESWEKVISLDRNNQLAYKGAAKAYFNLKDYKKSAEYAKIGSDRKLYSEAFKKLRTEFLERNFSVIFLCVVLLFGMLAGWIVYRKKHGIQLVSNIKARTMMSSLLHPFDSFQAVREKGYGSVPLATEVLVLWYIFSVLNETLGGFANTVFDSSRYNSVYVLMSTVGLIILWTVTNWLVTSLLGGLGGIKEIYIVSCYSLIPVVFSTALDFILSFVLMPDESAFLKIFTTVCVLYAFFMLMAGISKIHDYEFSKFFGTLILSVIGMMIIIFLLFLIFLLSQQIYGWVSTLFVEIRYR